MDEHEVKHMLINPFYAVNVESVLAQRHQQIVSRETWVQANTKLIEKIGAEEWLVRLLNVLEGDYPRTPTEKPSKDQLASD